MTSSSPMATSTAFALTSPFTGSTYTKTTYHHTQSSRVLNCSILFPYAGFSSTTISSLDTIVFTTYFHCHFKRPTTWPLSRTSSSNASPLLMPPLDLRESNAPRSMPSMYRAPFYLCPLPSGLLSSRFCLPVSIFLLLSSLPMIRIYFSIFLGDMMNAIESL
jgi:hypothetical protein